MASLSLTGTWGSETFGPTRASSLPQTTTQECYDMTLKLQASAMENNKFAKFTTLKNAGQLVLKPHNMSPLKSDADDSGASDKYLTTQQAAFGVGSKKTPVDITQEIPVALGRSGARVEKGLSGSGLTGEILNSSTEPSKNSFVQRMWMYQNDNALYYRQNGVPVAEHPEGLSFAIGEKVDLASTKKSKMRTSTDLMFNPVKKTGYKIFQDDEHGEQPNLEYHYKC